MTLGICANLPSFFLRCRGKNFSIEYFWLLLFFKKKILNLLTSDTVWFFSTVFFCFGVFALGSGGSVDSLMCADLDLNH